MLKSQLFQSLIDSTLVKNPNSKGILIHIEAPDYGVSWSGVAANSGASTGQTIHANSPALIASITKTYVAAAILRLVEQGKFKLFDSIEDLLPPAIAAMMKTDAYDLQEITLAHLLANTSGIFDYVNAPLFQTRTTSEPSYEWTRREQIELAMKDGSPKAQAGAQFSYSDTNFLLLTEIMETSTGRPFHQSIRQLLRYDEFGLDSTWFPILEDTRKHLKPRIKQYATGYKVNSHDLHPTFDLYGGGGIIATTKDMALFVQCLFEGRIFESRKTRDLLFTKMTTKDAEPQKYYMGIAEIKIDGRPAYGHGGFWGSMVKYIPELNCTIGIFLLERDEWPLNIEIMGKVCQLLQQSQ